MSLENGKASAGSRGGLDADSIQAASEVLKQLPDGRERRAIADALRRPSRKALGEAAAALLKAGHLEAAEQLYRALCADPAAPIWFFLGLARVASQRGDCEAIVCAWSACVSRFPERAAPSWFLEIVRAERRRGNPVAAEECLRAGLERFPDFVSFIATRAEIRLASGKPQEAIDDFRDAITRAPDTPSWYMGLARALRDSERFDEERDVLAALAARFPDNAWTLAFRAQDASRQQDWPGAYALWTQCFDRDPNIAKPEWLCGRAMALHRTWRSAEALEAWADIRRRFPDFVRAWRDAAMACQEMGRWSEAEALWNTLIGRNPETAELGCYVARASCYLNQPHTRSVEEAIAELKSKFLDAPHAHRLALNVAAARHLGLEAFSGLVAEAIDRFPEDRSLRGSQVHSLLASGRFNEAEDVARSLEESGDDSIALIARWSIVAERDGESAIRDNVHVAVTTRRWEPSSALSLCNYLLGLRTPWALTEALLLCEAVDRHFPGHYNVASTRARILVELGRNSEALALIDALAAICETLDAMELRAWAAAQRDERETAQGLWNSILSRYRFPALHGPEPNLELIATGAQPVAPDDVIAFAVARDEMANLPAFLAHHRRLGVGQFVFVDNMSNDATAMYLQSQPDVILYRTADSFPAATAGMRWVNALIQRHGQGRWCLFADADEEFIFPGCETISLRSFVRYLDSVEAEAVAAFMLDVFPEHLSDSSGAPTLRSECRYFDNSYVRLGNVRAPYWRPVGGVRYRLFEVADYLHKVPLMRSDRGVYLGNHETTPLRFAPVTGAMLHYKCTDLFAKAGQYLRPQANGSTAPDRIPGSMKRYGRYASWLASKAAVDLRAADVTEILGDSLSLAERGLMKAPAEFRAWLSQTREPT